MRKPVFIVLSVAALLCTASFAGDRKVIDEKAELQDRLVELEHGRAALKATNLQQLRSELENTLLERRLTGAEATGVSYTFSTDPEDLQPLTESKWLFEYKIITKFDMTIDFGGTVQTDADGYAYLTCSDKYGNQGIVMYTHDVPSNPYVSGDVFSVVIDRSSLFSFLTFQVDGASADGFYMHQVKSTGDYSNTYPLTGTLLSASSPDPDPMPPTPSPGSWLEVPGILHQVACGDFNGDGKTDIAGVTSTGQIFYSVDCSTWQSVSGRLSQITAGDFDGDGRDDLAGLTNDGQIFFTTDLQNWQNVPGAFNQLASGDLDGDGRDEIVGVTSSGQIYYNLD